MPQTLVSSEISTSTAVYSILIALIPALMVAIASGFFSSWLTARGIRKQSRWERRATAYSDILEHLSVLRHVYGEWEREYMNHLEFGDTYGDWLRQKSLESTIAVERASGIGDFHLSLIAKQALTSLRQTFEAMHDNLDWYQVIDTTSEALRKATTTMKAEAESVWDSK